MPKKAGEMKCRDLSDAIWAEHLKNRLLFIDNEITQETVHAHLNDLFYLAAKGSQPIRIIMSSPGGEVYAGLALYNTILDITRRGIPVTIDVMGLAASMAVEILQAGTHRQAYKYTRFLLHEISEIKVLSEETATQAEEHVAELVKLNRMLAEIVAGRAGKKPEEVLALIKKKDYYMSAEEAKKFGIIDSVLS